MGQILTNPARTDVLLALGLGILTIFGIRETLEYRPEARLFPMIILFILLGLCLAQFVRAARQWRAEFRNRVDSSVPTTHSESQAVESGDAVTRPDWLIAGWIVSSAVALWLFGIVWGSFAYILIFKSLYEGSPFEAKRIVKAAMLAVGVAFFLSYVFSDLLGIRLAPGVLV